MILRPLSTSGKQQILFLGITLFILASAIAMVLWQEKNQHAISSIAADHRSIIVSSVRMKEELANMQLHLIQKISTGLNPDSREQDLFGGQYNPSVSRHTLYDLLDAVKRLQAKTGSPRSISEKLQSRLDTLFSFGLDTDAEDSLAFDRARLQLQSLVLNVEQLEAMHNLQYKQQTRRLDATIQRDYRILLIFLLALALLSYLLIQWAQRLINLSLEQQHLSERELLRSQQQLNNLLKALPDTVMRLDSDGTILESRGRQTILASAKTDVIGKTLADMPLPNDVQQGLLNAIETELATGQVCIYEFDLPAEEQSYEARIIRYGDDEVIAIMRDITAQEVIRRQRKSLTTELENKNAELERFVYTVSHDLKTPLVTINGYIGLLQQAIDANDAKRINSDLGQITRAANSMADLLDGLLELSRIGRIVNPPEVGSLGYLVNNAVDIVREKMVARGVELEIEKDMPQYWGDRLRLLEVFQNLLENAIKFMGDQAEPRIRISAVENGDAVVCRVEDNGIGIDPRYHDRIFNLFERLNPEIDGSGIGMSLVHRIIEAHGGTIEVESAGEQQGSAIVFTLPIMLDQKNQKTA
jgi:signal transduction histidine kinase